MSTSFFVFDEFRNLLALIVLELIFTMPVLRRRNRFWLRLALGILGALAISTLYVHIHSYLQTLPNPTIQIVVSVAWYVFVLVIASLLVLLCFHITPTELAWVALSTYAGQHIAYALVYEAVYMGVLRRAISIWAMFGLYFVAAGVIDALIAQIFIPPIKSRGHLYIAHSTKNFLAILGLLAFFLASTFLNQYSAMGSLTAINYFGIISDLFNCVFVLVVQHMSLRNARILVEKETVATLLENEKRQYETFRSAVEYINIKCHDLKKEITAMAREGKLNADYIDEITDQIAVYDSFVNTGIDTLDSLLTDKNLLCLQKNISLSVMSDAAGLKSWKNRDLYVLFGNLLDNAIEYVQTLPNAEDRYIRLLVRRTGAMTVIHQENPLKSRPDFVDNLPQTTKADRQSHGFGLKSMQRIVGKYRGIMRIDTENRLFAVEIMIPEKN